jgi:hypothetical protein
MGLTRRVWGNRGKRTIRSFSDNSRHACHFVLSVSVYDSFPWEAYFVQASQVIDFIKGTFWHLDRRLAQDWKGMCKIDSHTGSTRPKEPTAHKKL